jgi:predicted NACHT family NTPase
MFIAQSARGCDEYIPRVLELTKELQLRLEQMGELEGAELDEEMLGQGAGLEEEILAQNRRAYLDQSPRSILAVVNDPAFSRLVILGDPGSGKSTLLRYILLQWAGKAAPNLKQDPLPLLIELREYARLRHEDNAVGFLEYLHRGPSVRWLFDQVQLNSWLKANPSILLFDGLDEVFDPALRKQVAMAIYRFADEYPSARVLVTSRIVGYQHQTWRDEGFRHFMLQELEDPQIGGLPCPLAPWRL